MGLGKTLRALREARGWSLRKLGAKIDVTGQAVASWERGATSPEAVRLARLADVFGMTMDKLYGRSPPTSEGSIPQPQGPTTVVERDAPQQSIAVALDILRPDLPQDELRATPRTNGLRALRERRGWTIPQAAEAMGLSLGGYRKVEEGVTRLSQDRIEKAKTVYGATSLEVLGEVQPEPRVAPLFAPQRSGTESGLDVAFLERLAIATLIELGHPEAQSRSLVEAWHKAAQVPQDEPDDANIRFLARHLVKLFT